MNYQIYAHRYADIILNSDYELKKEIEEIIKSISYNEIIKNYEFTNKTRKTEKRKEIKGKQTILNQKFKETFIAKGWDKEKYVFENAENSEQELKIDFLKRDTAVDIAFNHRSFIGGDLLRLQAAAEVTHIIKVGVYICAKKEFLKKISKDANSLVSFERTEWYLKNFYPVLTVPILLFGLTE